MLCDEYLFSNTDGVLTHFIKDSWEELLSSCGKREESRDVGEHTGHNEWVLGLIVQHGLEQPHALVYGEFLQRKEEEDFLKTVISIVHLKTCSATSLGSNYLLLYTF